MNFLQTLFKNTDNDNDSKISTKEFNDIMNILEIQKIIDKNDNYRYTFDDLVGYIIKNHKVELIDVDLFKSHLKKVNLSDQDVDLIIKSIKVTDSKIAYNEIKNYINKI